MSRSINHNIEGADICVLPSQEFIFHIILLRLICRADAYAVENVDENGSQQDALRSLLRRLKRVYGKSMRP